MPFLPASSHRALTQLVLAALLWSTGGVLIKAIGLNPFALAGTRSLVAAIVIRMVIGRPKFNGSSPQLGGALAYTGTVLFYVAATRWTTAANAVLLMYTAPIYIILFAPWFLGEKSSWKDWLAVLFVMSGILVFFLDQLSPSRCCGNLIALASGFCFAWMTLFLRKQKNDSPVESVLLGNLIAAALGLPFYLTGPLPNGTDLGLLLVLGTFQLGIAYLLYSQAIRSVRAFYAILITMLEPILNPVWVFFVHGERPSLWAVAGGTIMLSTLVIHHITTDQSAGPPARTPIAD